MLSVFRPKPGISGDGSGKWRKHVLFTEILIAVLVFAVAGAIAGMIYGIVTHPLPRHRHRALVNYTLPEGAVKISENEYVWNHPTEPIQSHIYITRAGDMNKRRAEVLQPATSNSTDAPLDLSCTGPLYDGVRWVDTENYVVDATNSDGVDPDVFFSNFQAAVASWQSYIEFHPIGSGTQGAVDPSMNFNGKNEVKLQAIDIGGVTDAVAVTQLYHTCPSMDSSGNCIGDVHYVEWKQIYDTTHYPYGDAQVDPSKFDTLSLETHELGHVLGLKDIYTSVCNYVTMYGYIGAGQWNKRTQEAPDIYGVQTELGYGAAPGEAVSATADGITKNPDSATALVVAGSLLFFVFYG